jgi:hypothetical protein
MNTRYSCLFTAVGATRRLVLCALLAALAAPLVAADAFQADGLQTVKLKGLDEARQKPGANLGRYTGILLRPVTVTFSKNWRPRDYGTFGLKHADVERIRSSYAKIADETFARVLSKGGHDIATAPGRNVLEIQLEIVDLYVNAPDDQDVLVRTYVRNAGDMRLLITLRDSTSGEVLFHGRDLNRGDDSAWLQRASSVYNSVEAERVFTGWARQLQRLMDE